MSFGRVVSAICLGVVFFGAGVCPAQGITRAAAADLQFAMQDITSRFEKETGKTVKVIYGSSGNFFQQIQNGAPFDVFFSANLDYPKKLEAADLTEKGTYYQYASGKIVLWVSNDSKLDLNLGLRALLDPAIKKIAIANPQHAPYGQAAMAAMQKRASTIRFRRSWCWERTLADGVVCSFRRRGRGHRRSFTRPLAQYERSRPLRRNPGGRLSAHPASLCCSEILPRNKEMARQFLVFLKTAEVSELLKTYGFDVPDASAKDR